MGNTKHHARMLWLGATDRTFDRAVLKGVEVLAGKCIHCNCMVCIGLDGSRVKRATLEHIVPRCHGGTNALENLAIACGRCNGAKGIRHDSSPWGDPKLMAMIERLQDRRKKRLREALPGIQLPDIPHDEAVETNPMEAKPTARGRRRR
jgi:hypothetical protein